MTQSRFQNLVQSVDALRELLGPPSELAVKKQCTRLDQHMLAFIAQAPLVLIGTTGRDGTCDVSPRGDAVAAARALDPQTLVIPERRGNRRADSLRNILETGQVGLLFLIPGLAETLRVNGRGSLVRDAELLETFTMAGQTPLLAITVAVEECFLQCGKALIRSRLWEARAESAAPQLACFASMLVDQAGIPGQTVAEVQAQIDESYRNRLY